jgi:7-cyano-7-deazaguanine synthase
MQALALVSGGIDSTVALWWALDQGYEVHALTMHYFKRPPPERQATETITELAGVELTAIEMPWMRELEDPVHPLLDNPALADAPEGYVPARNPILYALAAHVAEIVGAETVVGGHNGVDPERFPDASASFFERFGDLMADSLHSDVDLTIEQPLLGLDKTEVVERGLERGAPVEASWSCYELGPDPRRECPACEERARAFQAAGVGGT